MSKGDRYREILSSKKGIVNSKTKKPAKEFIEWLKTQPSGFQHTGLNFISTIKNGFIVRFKKWNNNMFDIYEFDGTLLFCDEKELSNSVIKPLCGTFTKNDKYDDVIKVHLREKKIKRLLGVLKN